MQTNDANAEGCRSPLPEALVRLLPAVLAILIFARTLGAGFVSDDVTLILKSDRVHSLKNVPRMFAQDFSQTRGAGETAGYYRPVVTSSFAVDYALGGPARPWVFHLTNVLAYAVCAALVYALLRRIIGERTGALLGGVLFACLAVHTETVAWVSGRTDLFALTFMCGAALCLLRARGGEGTFLYGAACVLMLLALLSKETALALLPMWIAFELTAGRRHGSRAKPGARIGGIVALAVACAAYFLMRFAALGTLGSGAGVRNFDPWTLHGLATVALCVWQYLGRLVLPAGLSFAWEVTPLRTAADWGPALCLLGGAALAALTVWASIRRPAVGFALWWIWLGLAPALNFVPIAETVAVRFLFVPSLGFCLLIGLAVREVRSARARTGDGEAWPRRACAAVVVLALAQAALAVTLSGDWRSSRALYLSALRSDPDSPIAQELAAEAYLRDTATPERAALHFGRCLELAVLKRPLQVLAHNGLGTCFVRGRNLAAAMRHLREALRLDRGLVRTRGSLALVLVEMARQEKLPRAWTLAREHADQLLRRGAAREDAYVVLGCYQLERAGDPAGAGALFEKAAEIEPTFRRAAEAAFDEAVQRNPGDAEAHYQLAIVCERMGNMPKALRAATRADKIKPTKAGRDLLDRLQQLSPPGVQ